MLTGVMIGYQFAQGAGWNLTATVSGVQSTSVIPADTANIANEGATGTTKDDERTKLLFAA